MSVLVVLLCSAAVHCVQAAAGDGNAAAAAAAAARAAAASGDDDQLELGEAEETLPDEQPWSAYDRLKQVKVGPVSVGDSLKPLLTHSFSLSRPQMQRSLSYLGPHQRLRRVIDQMLKGGDRPIKVGVVGGSISYGHGEL
jgi:hypothetical protein